MKKPKSRRAPPARATKRRARGVLKDALVVVAVAGGLLAVGLLGREKGAFDLLDARRDVKAAKARIAEVEARVVAREVEAEALGSDPSALEAAIRADLGLARPGEWVVREEGLSTLRNP